MLKKKAAKQSLTLPFSKMWKSLCFVFTQYFFTKFSLNMMLDLNTFEESEIVRLGRVKEGFYRYGAIIDNNTNCDLMV